MTDEDGKPINHDKLWNAYTKYKRMVPTCGVALINAKESKVSQPHLQSEADEIDFTSATFQVDRLELAAREDQ